MLSHCHIYWFLIFFDLFLELSFHLFLYKINMMLKLKLATNQIHHRLPSVFIPMIFYFVCLFLYHLILFTIVQIAIQLDTSLLCSCCIFLLENTLSFFRLGQRLKFYASLEIHPSLALPSLV